MGRRGAGQYFNDVNHNSFILGRTSPSGGTQWLASITMRWDFQICQNIVGWNCEFRFKEEVQDLYYTVLLQVRLLAEKLSDQPESQSDKDKEVCYLRNLTALIMSVPKSYYVLLLSIVKVVFSVPTWQILNALERQVCLRSARPLESTLNIPPLLQYAPNISNNANLLEIITGASQTEQIIYQCY